MQVVSKYQRSPHALEHRGKNSRVERTKESRATFRRLI